MEDVNINEIKRVYVECKKLNYMELKLLLEDLQRLQRGRLAIASTGRGLQKPDFSRLEKNMKHKVYDKGECRP